MQTKTLFSQHYLETRLPQHAEWNEDPRPVFEALRALWDKAQQFGETWSEAQTEDEFIKPALEALGWNYIVQPKARHAGRITRPDYALFADTATQQDAYPLQGDDAAFYSRALAIAEAKFWGRPLSQKESSGRESWKTGENPSHQMVSYLVGTRAPWGILTNGRVWRLYSREVSSTASEFYEVDLGGIMNHESRIMNHDSAIHDSFRRFWLFFRRDAFIPDAQGKCFVQRVHEGSATYAREISDKLKELVYAEVMPEIAGYMYRDLKLRFIIASALESKRGFEIYYHFSDDGTGCVINLHVILSKDKPEIQSLTPLFEGSSWIEREMHEILGIEFRGHPNLEKLISEGNWAEGVYPYRKDL